MENGKSIVESTLLQIKAVEDAISENAKGILASTMKEEISELVRESLGSKRRIREQEEEPTVDVEDEVEVDAEEDPEGTEEPESEMLSADFEGQGLEPQVGDNEMPPLNMTQAPMKDVFKVFKAMGDQDGIVVVKDEDDVYLKDGENEYIIRTGADETNTEEMMSSNMNENVLYELVINEQEDDTFESWSKEVDEQEEEEYESEQHESYFDKFEVDEPEFESNENVYEVDLEELESVVESFKAIGMGFGKPKSGLPKSSVNNKGFNEDKKSGGKGITGKGPKFKYPSIKHGVTEVDMEEEEFEGWSKEMDEEEGMMEPKEASRTMTYRRRAERGRVTAPSQIRKESVNNELNLLKEKNEEYKKALDFFRTKLNEVAVFNSNLAYSTRLFTEHSTTKQEKINILRRFDGVESLKESKNLYQSIKKELDGGSNNGVVSESIQRKVIKTPQTGSASNLIESKTYENPQFLRMKDLMTKIK
jgi:hypothetical protein